MADIALYIGVAAAAYIIGSFPTAYLIVRRFAGRNIMELGSGNVGTLNVLRATGSKVLTAANLLGDVTKGVLAMLLGLGLAAALGRDPAGAMALGGIVAVVGHNYSAFLRLQGGKGIATALPVLFVFEPFLVAVWVATFLVTVAATRILVLGQILGTVVTPIVGYIWFARGADTWVNADWFGFTDATFEVAVLAIIVFVRHA